MNFRSGSKLLQGPGQINKQTKIANSRGGGGGGGGGGPITPKKTLYLRMDTTLIPAHLDEEVGDGVIYNTCSWASIGPQS